MIRQACGKQEKAAFGDLYAREIESFSNSLQTGAPLEVPVSDAVHVQYVMEAAYASGGDGCKKMVIV